jgi:hypothetical protein
MSIIIQPYRQDHQNAVIAFNQRLRAATSNPDLVFYERSTSSWLPRVEGSPLRNEYFLALEDGTVRGAYALKYERFFLAGHGEYDVACYHHPLSEGIVNRNYAAVGSLLLRDAVWREPILYALGMGGADRPIAKMLNVMGWNLQPVPFYFRVVRPYKFLRRMNVLRQSSWKRWLMDLGAFSGTGWAAISAAQAVKRMRAHQASAFEVVEVDEFPAWADVLWHEANDSYRLASVRNRQTLSRLYPPSEKHLTKLFVTSQGTPIGWAVVGERRKDTKFGSLRVGSIVDCWARLENAPQVMRAATQVLERLEMDLIVSNQSHKLWGRALEGCGFLRAESNFIFATSKKHSALLRGHLSEFHLTRANGDGLPRNF